MPGVGDRLRTHVANAVQQIQAEVRGIQDEVGAPYIPSVLTPHRLLTEHRNGALCRARGTQQKKLQTLPIKVFQPSQKEMHSALWESSLEPK